MRLRYFENLRVLLKTRQERDAGNSMCTLEVDGPNGSSLEKAEIESAMSFSEVSQAEIESTATIDHKNRYKKVSVILSHQTSKP